MKTLDQQREFEQWAVTESIPLFVDEFGGYAFQQAHTAWLAWQEQERRLQTAVDAVWRELATGNPKPIEEEIAEIWDGVPAEEFRNVPDSGEVERIGEDDEAA